MTQGLQSVREIGLALLCLLRHWEPIPRGAGLKGAVMSRKMPTPSLNPRAQGYGESNVLRDSWVSTRPSMRR